MSEIGRKPNRLCELRRRAKLSQQMVADQVGVSKVTISSLERGKMVLSLDYMFRIAKTLGLPAVDLLKADEQDALVGCEEMQLIRAYRAAEKIQRKLIFRIAEPLRFTAEGQVV